MKYVINTLFFLVATFLVGALYANTITKHESKYGNDTQLRFDVTAVNESDLTPGDIGLLNEFLKTTDLAAISCTMASCEIINKKLKELDPTSIFETRLYNSIPRILNVKASQILPILRGNSSKGALTVVTIEPREGDIRAVFVRTINHM